MDVGIRPQITTIILNFFRRKGKYLSASHFLLASVSLCHTVLSYALWNCPALSLSLSSAFISLFIFNSVHKELGSTIQSGLIKFKGVFPIFVNGRNRESIFQDPEWGLVNMLQDYNSLMDNPLHLSLETKSLTHYKIL